MSLPLVAGGVVGIGAIATASYFGVTYLTQGKDTTKPLVTLDSIANFKEGGANAQHFGGVYARYFLDVDHENNTKKWSENYKRFESLTTPVNNGFFSGVTGDNKTIEKFKKACGDQYKVARDNNKDAEWEEIWTYCSLGEKPLITLDNDSEKTKFESKGEYQGKVAATYKSKLLSVDSTDNDWFWNIREKEFKSTLSPDSSKDKYFNSKKTSTPKVKDICKLAYQEASAVTSPAADNQLTVAELMKFCSHKKQPS